MAPSPPSSRGYGWAGLGSLGQPWPGLGIWGIVDTKGRVPLRELTRILEHPPLPRLRRDWRKETEGSTRASRVIGDALVANVRKCSTRGHGCGLQNNIRIGTRHGELERGRGRSPLPTVMTKSSWGHFLMEVENEIVRHYP
jgi:hypothetical protein